MFAGTALSVRLFVCAGLSLFIIYGPYLYVVVCVFYAYNLTVVGSDLAHRRLSHNDLMNINRSIKLDLTSPHSTINPGDNFHFKLTASWSCFAFYGCFSVIVIASVSLLRDINTVYGLIGSIIKHTWERYGKRKSSCLCLIFRLW